MIKKIITLKNKSGLHARPASQLTHLAQSFQSSITLSHGTTEANAKSIISLLAAGIKCGTTLEIQVNGSDEQEASDAIISLIEELVE